MKAISIILRSLAVAGVVAILAGCSGSGAQGPLTPAQGQASAAAIEAGRFLWGVWDCRFDPAEGKVELSILRAAGFHVNVAGLLKPPDISIHFNDFDPVEARVDLDVSLTNPYDNSNLRGFDVRGILMGTGDTVWTPSDVPDASPVFAASDGTRLENADGYTRWWNALQFTSPGLFGFSPGVLGSKNLVLETTLNPYKYFADALGPTDRVADKVNLSNRGTFSPGATCTRNYVIRFPFIGGKPVYKFQYAIDASWAAPNGAHPKPEPVEDFPFSANCPEAYQISVDASQSTLYYIDDDHRGGTLKLAIEVFDWGAPSNPAGIDGEISGITIASTTLFDSLARLPVASFPGSQPTSGVYLVTMPHMLPTGLDNQEILITVFSSAPTGYEPPVGGPAYPSYGSLAAYTLVSIPVQTSPSPSDESLVWAKRAGGENGLCYGHGITALSDSSLVTTGEFTVSTTFGTGEPNETVLNSQGVEDIFIARYDPDGSLMWAVPAGGAAEDVGFSIATLSDDSLAVTGQFGTEAVFGQGEPNTTILSSAGTEDIFIARYNPDGTVAWAKSAGGIADDYGYGITTLPNDSICITGYFHPPATFGQGEPNETVLSMSGDYGVFVAQYNPDGSLAWAKSPDGTYGAWANAIASLSDNSVVVSGQFCGSITFGKGEPNETTLESTVDYQEDLFIARYNQDGSLEWARSVSDLYGIRSIGIVPLSDDSTVLTGYMHGSATFGKGESNETVLTSLGASDIFLARFNPDGTLAWARSAGGGGTDYDAGCAVTALSDDSAVVTGYFGENGYERSVVFGSGELNQTVLIPPGNGGYLFVARYNPDGSLAWARQAGGWGSCYGRAITSLPDDSTVAAGYFSSYAKFGQGEPNQTVLISEAYWNFFVARYNP